MRQAVGGSADTCVAMAPSRNLSFGQALELLKSGRSVRRSIWKGHWFLANEPYCQCPSSAGGGYVRAFSFKDGLIVAVLANNGGCAPAQPYQGDLLANDWEIAYDA